MKTRTALCLVLAMVSAPLCADAARYAYVGTYNPNGEGVYRFAVNPEDGSLSARTLVSGVSNPAQLVANAAGTLLFVGSEVADFNGGQQGGLSAYRINPQDGSLTLLNQVTSAGQGPVWLSLTPDEKFLLVANYVSGSVAAFPVAADGKLGAAVSVQQQQGEPGAARPAAAVEGSFAISDHNGPHAHMIESDPSGRFAFSTDLGLDRIYQWRRDPATGALTPNDPPFIPAASPGAGPRHLVFHPTGDTLFVIAEEASVVTSYRLNRETGTLTPLHSLSSLPPEYQGTSFAAGLVLGRDGKNLYVANRLHNSIGQIAVTPEGGMRWVGEVWTRGDYPRSLTLDPAGKTIYVMNQRSDNITRFRVDPTHGTLTFTGDYTPVGSPSQLIMVP